ncbi:PREDICTED: probable low affinity copper uptake protein 2 isoform X1 [Acropora digitifera]|uniref:probable low affinity copper uptake protein 2 isoform X1 n=1 Tax=Acropora digitifera TaxID=70779 RepID=UPI00077AC200|nr:PREDICTED: probable low affinity copper uptake protein 2 isoform X1 [Acropora digitifera]XP_015753248.1 PREDICTED: probable low affinity copper uptake protein 2 isoform X1 [Acropora digitifera]
MTMAFSTTEEVRILLQQWKVTSFNGLSGSMMAVLALAVLYECLSAYHRYLSLSDSKIRTPQGTSKYKRTKDCVLRTLYFALRYTLGYLLMLVAGTFDVMLFVSIIVGAGIGYFLSDPLCTWYGGIKYGASENEYQRNENDDYRPITRLTHSV